jgi:hypothetical protein
MHPIRRRIPIFRAYPVRLSLAMVERLAEGEVHPEVEAAASTTSPHIRNEVGLSLISHELQIIVASGLGSRYERSHRLSSKIVKQLTPRAC